MTNYEKAKMYIDREIVSAESTFKMWKAQGLSIHFYNMDSQFDRIFGIATGFFFSHFITESQYSDICEFLREWNARMIEMYEEI